MLIVGGGLVLIGLAAYVALRGVRETAQAAGAGAVGLVADVGAGVVVGIGDAIGLPQTDAQKAEAARRAGDIFGASIYMPAGEFIGWLAAGAPRV